MFLYRFDYTLKLNVTYNDSNIKISFITLIRITIYWMMMIIKIIRLIIIHLLANIVFTCKHCEILLIKYLCVLRISIGTLKRILIAVFHAVYNFETHW